MENILYLPKLRLYQLRLSQKYKLYYIRSIILIKRDGSYVSNKCVYLSAAKLTWWWTGWNSWGVQMSKEHLTLVPGLGAL